MKKRLISSLLAASVVAMSSSALAFSPETYSTDVTVYLNAMDVYTNSENKPCIMNDRTMVQVKPIFEEMGFTASYDEETGLATFRNETMAYAFIDGDYTMYSVSDSGELSAAATLDVPATIYNDTFYVPLRAFCEAAVGTIMWKEESRSVYIITDIQNRLHMSQDTDTTTGTDTTADTDSRAANYGTYYAYDESGNAVARLVLAEGLEEGFNMEYYEITDEGETEIFSALDLWKGEDGTYYVAGEVGEDEFDEYVLAHGYGPISEFRLTIIDSDNVNVVMYRQDNPYTAAYDLDFVK